jgi:hypothetical protein
MTCFPTTEVREIETSGADFTKMVVNHGPIAINVYN